MGEPSDHHVVPQFVLRNFAVDDEKQRVTTVAKDGNFAIWMERSIKGIGWEPDFYVHTVGGVPVSVETDLNHRIETPVSASDTWAKITSGRADTLDYGDRPILYSLVRHLEIRTPHYLQTVEELMAQEADPNSPIPFSDEEREMYAFFRANPDVLKQSVNERALHDFSGEYERCFLAVMRSPIPLRSSTTPVVAAPFENMPGLHMPAPGMAPFQRRMAVDPFTIVAVVAGDFGGAFLNYEISAEEAAGYNRSVAGQFATFPAVRHMICGPEQLIEDLTWTPYEVVKDTPTRKIFRRPDAEAK
jgi:hypothetical protein